MQCFAIVRDADALVSACERLPELLAWIRRSGGGDPELLGIWIDPVRVVEVPASLGGAGGPWEIVASAGLSGLWTLCWVAGPPLDHRTLLDALAGACDRAGGFHPVLPGGGGAAGDRALGDLAARHGDLIRSPLLLDGDRGRLGPPPEPTPWPRAQSS